MSQPGEHLYQWLLDQETQGDDDRRFYASYLLGHVSLSMADHEEHQMPFRDHLDQSINAALEVDRLSETDITGIRSLIGEYDQSAQA
jgi:hypothetical protein